MDRFLGRYATYIYAVLRIVTGFLFMWHGTQKLFGFPPSQGGGELSAFMAVGGGIEFLGGVLIMIGLFTSVVAFISSGTMAVAYWGFHGTAAVLPIVNRGELAVLYCFVLLYIAARGSGVWSVESIFKGSRSPSNG